MSANDPNRTSSNQDVRHDEITPRRPRAQVARAALICTREIELLVSVVAKTDLYAVIGDADEMNPAEPISCGLSGAFVRRTK